MSATFELIHADDRRLAPSERELAVPSEAIHRLGTDGLVALSLERAGLSLTAWPLAPHEGPQILGTACLRVVHGGEVRWLGRKVAAPSLEVGGLRVPGLVEVPRSWLGSVLDSCLRQSEWPRYVPWYSEPGFVPLASWSGNEFSYASFRSHAPGRLLRRLAASMHEHLRRSSEPWNAFAELIAELRRVGHDLWSTFFEPGGEQWGSDYMRQVAGQGLWISARYQPLGLEVGFNGAQASAGHPLPG